MSDPPRTPAPARREKAPKTCPECGHAFHPAGKCEHEWRTATTPSEVRCLCQRNMAVHLDIALPQDQMTALERRLTAEVERLTVLLGVDQKNLIDHLERDLTSQASAIDLLKAQLAQVTAERDQALAELSSLQALNIAALRHLDQVDK